MLIYVCYVVLVFVFVVDDLYGEYVEWQCFVFGYLEVGGGLVECVFDLVVVYYYVLCVVGVVQEMLCVVYVVFFQQCLDVGVFDVVVVKLVYGQ